MISRFENLKIVASSCKSRDKAAEAIFLKDDISHEKNALFAMSPIPYNVRRFKLFSTFACENSSIQ